MMVLLEKQVHLQKEVAAVEGSAANRRASSGDGLTCCKGRGEKGEERE